MELDKEQLVDIIEGYQREARDYKEHNKRVNYSYDNTYRSQMDKDMTVKGWQEKSEPVRGKLNPGSFSFESERRGYSTDQRKENEIIQLKEIVGMFLDDAVVNQMSDLIEKTQHALSGRSINR